MQIKINKNKKVIGYVTFSKKVIEDTELIKTIDEQTLPEDFRENYSDYSYKNNELLYTKKTEIEKQQQKQEEKEEANRLKQNRESLKYLSDTDWYIIRFQETGVPIPQEVLDARAKAREAVK